MGRLIKLFDREWRFILADDPGFAHEDFNDSDWRLLNLPHDWSIEGEYSENNPSGKRGGYLPTGIGWYRKTFLVNKEWIDKRIFIDFDGIYMNSDVWVNGYLLGHRPYGYIGFEYDITPYIKPGCNTVAVRADNSKAPSGRWYTGCGIYRHVWLTVKDTVHIGHWGVHITTPEITKKNAIVSIETRVENHSKATPNLTLESTVYDENGCIIGNAIQKFKCESDNKINLNTEINLDSPELWSPENPCIYVLVSKIIIDGKIIDEVKNTLGIRSFSFDADTGFTLNNKITKIKGVCLHHDAGPVGAAVPESLLLKRFRMLKEMGCNAIRTSHNPMAPEFYDMCDKMGFIVMDEAFDGWNEPKATSDYGLYFDEWWQRDLIDIIMRDRNHPSIMIWSLGNEIHNMQTDITQKLLDTVHSADPTRPVTCGINGVTDISDINRSLLDVAGYNEGGGACFLYEQDRIKYPLRRFIATEAPHTFQTRGFYRTQTWWRDKNKPRKEIENLTDEEIFTDGSIHYSSSYDNSGVRINARDSWALVTKYPYLAGEFRWTGFDYLGESFGWPARMWNFGVIDLANFPKDHFYLYQSLWTEKPMIHLLPHWNHSGKEDIEIPVCVHTNCDEAELSLNGISLGRKLVSQDVQLTWNVHYQPGDIRAVGYKNGVAAVEKSSYTAGDPCNIELTKEYLNNESKQFNMYNNNICQINSSITDKNGTIVPDADHKVNILLYGGAELLGMENGDPIDHTPHRVNYRRAFYGLGMGLVRIPDNDAEEQAGILVAGIIGDRVFTKKTKVYITVKTASLTGGFSERDYIIYYTIDGSDPCEYSEVYKYPLEIDDSCRIKAVIYENGLKVMTISEDFRKGEREKVTDTDHGNRTK